jgi:sugar O-acyltransferase (sialic acid O-acetyltransferase NeuD family)
MAPAPAQRCWWSEMAEIVIFGVGQWAELAHFYFEHDSPHQVAAFTVDRAYLQQDTFKGLPVVAFEDVEGHYPPDRYSMFIPLSFKKMNHVRADRYNSAKQRGYQLVSYVSSKATTWPGLKCGENCFIFEDNTIQPFVEIGNNVVMWSGNHIGHHTVIKDHVMITSHVVISGCCTIEEYCFFGVNSSVRDEAVVAHDTLVGMGVAIVKDTKEFEVYRTPAVEPERVRSNQLRSLSYKTKG